MTVSGQDIVECARSFLGVRWHHQGRNHHGIDCGGLIALVAQELGLSFYDTIEYPRRIEGAEFIGHFRKGGLVEVPWESRRDGDVMLMRVSHGPASHAGFIVGRDRLIHAYAPRRMVVEMNMHPDWAAQRVALMRWPEVE